MRDRPRLRSRAALALGVAVLIAPGGCGREVRVQRGDPVETLTTVSFDSGVVGTGRVAWSTGDGWTTVTAPQAPGQSHAVRLLLPAGEDVDLRAEVVDAREKVHVVGRTTTHTPAAPSRIRFKRTVDDPRSQIGDGLLVLNAYDRDEHSYAFVLDRQARVRWWIEADRSDQRILRVRPGRDGASIVFGVMAEEHREDLEDGWITRWALDADQARTDTRALYLHHDFAELPDGRMSWLGWQFANPQLVSGLGPVPVAADAIFVADEGASGGDEAVVFSFLDDHAEEPWFVCEHMRPPGFVGMPWYEWTHGNSLDWDDQAGAWRGLTRYWDALWEIGFDGLHWQLGGRGATISGDVAIHHGHASELTGDRLVVFDNGDHLPPPVVSRIVAIDLDLAAGTASEAWSIPDPAGVFTTYLGDARVLPGGNVLVLWSPRGLLQEFDPSGDVVWEAAIEDHDMVVGRVTWTDALAPR